MNRANSKFFQLGISLLELMLSLAIITAILVTAVRYFEVTENAHKIETLAQNSQVIYAAGEKWLDDVGNFDVRPPNACTNADTLLTCFANLGYVPKDFAPDGHNAEPFGGTIIAKGQRDNNEQMQLLFSSVPNNMCQNIKTKLQDQATVLCMVANNVTMTITYNK